jgi:phosphoglycolate phosphatase-like HAD superfamily hydrolase
VLWGYGSREELEAAGADALVSTPADLVAQLAITSPSPCGRR